MMALGVMLAFVVAVPAAQADAGRALATCIRPIRSGDSAAAIIARPAGFDCSGDQKHWGSGDFWVVSQPLPADAGGLVRSLSLYQQSATLHVRYADGTIRTRRFDHGDAWRHLKLGSVFQLAIPQHAARPVRLLWEIRGAANTRGILLSPHIATVEEAQTREVTLAALYAAFGGICLSLLVSNVALWRSLRHGFRLPYCAMVATLLLYGLSTSGVLGPMLRMDNNLRLKINMVLLALTLTFALGFARSFFGSPVLSRRMRQVANVVTGLLVAAACAFAVLMPWQAVLLDRLAVVTFGMALTLVVPVLWGAWRAGVPYVRGFALAWAIPVVVAGLRIVQALGLVGWNFWLDNSTLFAMVMEATTSSIVIAWRIRLVSEERDAAREKESQALRLADRDPLTGLLNRRALLREVLASGGVSPRVLVLVDIDHFRQVNDALGHDGGDEVLRVFAATLQNAAPADALVARLGGEEFAVISPSQTTVLPDRLLDAIRGARMPFDLRVTASLGSSIGYLETEGDWTRLYREADRALYVAKNAGRDRARWAQAA
ncbi:MAG: GGDEF domain-containing protein [Sphingomonas adhaesiva]|uniref:sensor domain-containing diguanylate cyclase n=1 Tax=Sphingomonas adhaesiva TaxID=28212 RepID=UPI002FFAC6CE